MFRGNLLGFRVWQFPSGPVTGYQWKEPGSASPPGRDLSQTSSSTSRAAPAFSSLPPWQIFSSHYSSLCSLMDTLCYGHNCLGKPRAGHSAPEPHQVWVGGKDHVPSADGNINVAPRHHQSSLLQGLRAGSHLPRARAFSAKLLSSQAAPSTHWYCLGLLLFRSRTLHFVDPASPFLQAVRVLMHGSMTLWCTSQSTHLWITNKFAPSPKSLIKMFNRTGSRTHATSCQTPDRLWTTDHHSMDLSDFTSLSVHPARISSVSLWGSSWKAVSKALLKPIIGNFPLFSSTKPVTSLWKVTELVKHDFFIVVNPCWLVRWFCLY